mmetsp:Transcript_2455/g.2566  ORF Transcript_2455/g.2566 Transcript_2455/m.2566 type:complete len:338 (+) Transcript_2455:46-1059(+)
MSQISSTFETTTGVLRTIAEKLPISLEESFTLSSPYNYLDYRKALEFDMKEIIPDLFTFSNSSFTFNLKYLKAATKPEGSFEVARLLVTTDKFVTKQNFSVQVLSESFVEEGINYIGYFKILHEDAPEALQIRIPGIFTYDPAILLDSKIPIETMEYAFFYYQLGVTVAQIQAMRKGVHPDVIKQFQSKASDEIESFGFRFEMHEYMYYQVCCAIMEHMQPISYAEFLLKIAGFDIDVRKNQNQIHTVDYMNRYISFKNRLVEIIIPTSEYFQRIEYLDHDGLLMGKLGKNLYFKFIELGEEQKNYDIQYELDRKIEDLIVSLNDDLSSKIQSSLNE